MMMGKHAKLPAGIQSEAIEDMQPGDEGWTVPWAMFADENGHLWLNGSYTLRATHGGTVQMHVWRSEEDGLFRVDVRRCNHEWSRGGGSYCGSFRPVAVADISYMPRQRASDLIAEARRERDLARRQLEEERAKRDREDGRR